jgi:class 3 adenylate cyclase/tetratricopeptide (TPR) repeat protein
MTPRQGSVNASVLFMDIVKYSPQPMATQVELLAILQKAVQQSAEFQQAESAGVLRKLATGDGMALVFVGDHCAAAVTCAIQVTAHLKRHPKVQVRMGVNTGPVTLKPDINEKENVVGEGINIAARVMDHGDAGHILLSSAALDAIEDTWREHVQDMDLCEVKHGVFVHLYNLCGKEFGNPALPSKLCAAPAAVQSQTILPARPPLFVGREEELKTLRDRLSVEGSVVPVQGFPGLGKTTLAMEFAHRYKSDFDAVYWLQCAGKDLAAVASGFASQLGITLEGDLDKIVRALHTECGRKRCLLVLDNVEDEAPGCLIPGGRAAVLITTRKPHLSFLTHQESVSPKLFTEAECFEVFRDVLGAEDLERSEGPAKLLFEKLGYLPIAISVAAGLIKFDFHHSIESLANKLPPLETLIFGTENVGVLLKDAIAAAGENEQKLITAMAACAPDGFRLSLAAEVAELPEAASIDAVQGLISRSLVEVLDRGARRFRLHALVRVAADPTEALRLRHANAVHKRFKQWETDWRECQHDLGDVRQAFGWTLDQSSDATVWSLCGQLAYLGYSLTARIGRLSEAYEFCDRSAQEAERIGARSALQAWFGNQALILKAWGRLDEALALHKKQETICEELGDRDGLQVSYGNQALILRAWGRLDEALALHKKEETICEELGDRDGLQVSYGNQALILQAWGRLDEALALLKKQETICEELGNRDSLQRSYGNQAVILQAWGRLDEALALHKKQETICEELGDRDSLQRSYGNQASILGAWGRLDEALALLKKKEAICQELGLRDQLATCYWSQAVLAQARGDKKEAREKATAALAILTELRMPREIEGVTELLRELGDA